MATAVFKMELHSSHRISVPIEVDPWTFRPPPESCPIEIRQSNLTLISY